MRRFGPERLFPFALASCVVSAGDASDDPYEVEPPGDGAGVIGSGVVLADAACKVPGARAVGYGIPCMVGSSPPYLASLGGYGCIAGLCPAVARITEGL